MNKERFQEIINKIESNPMSWDQERWHCETAHCFAGHAQILSNKPINNGNARKDARVWLDLSKAEANYLFYYKRTLQNFKDFLNDDFLKLKKQYIYDSDEYDFDGYNYDEFDSGGYDCDGYDCDGYDCNGYNRDGYDCDGLDKNNKPKN
jgi:hypothetical protein